MGGEKDAPAEMPGVEGFSAAEPDIATTLATQIMALDWMDRRKWDIESQADRHGELQEMIDAALAPILAEKEREIAWLTADRDNSNGLLDACRHERNVLQKICAERADAIEAAEARALAAEAALAAERERCARIADERISEHCEDDWEIGSAQSAEAIAAAIRAQEPD